MVIDLANSGKEGWGKRELRQGNTWIQSGASCTGVSSPHTALFWRLAKKKFRVDLGREAGVKFSAQLLPFPHFPLVRMPDLISYCSFQAPSGRNSGHMVGQSGYMEASKKKGLGFLGQVTGQPCRFVISLYFGQGNIFIPRTREEITYVVTYVAYIVYRIAYSNWLFLLCSHD